MDKLLTESGLKQSAMDLGRSDGVQESLDTDLAESLGKVHATTDGAAGKSEWKNSRDVLAEHIEQAKSEPWIAPSTTFYFGVQIDMTSSPIASDTWPKPCLGRRELLINRRRSVSQQGCHANTMK